MLDATKRHCSSVKTLNARRKVFSFTVQKKRRVKNVATNSDTFFRTWNNHQTLERFMKTVAYRKIFAIGCKVLYSNFFSVVSPRECKEIRRSSAPAMQCTPMSERSPIFCSKFAVAEHAKFVSNFQVFLKRPPSSTSYNLYRDEHVRLR